MCFLSLGHRGGYTVHALDLRALHDLVGRGECFSQDLQLAPRQGRE